MTAVESPDFWLNVQLHCSQLLCAADPTNVLRSSWHSQVYHEEQLLQALAWRALSAADTHQFDSTLWPKRVFLVLPMQTSHDHPSGCSIWSRELLRVRTIEHAGILSPLLYMLSRELNGLFGSSHDKIVVGNEETQDCNNVHGLHILFQLWGLATAS